MDAAAAVAFDLEKSLQAGQALVRVINADIRDLAVALAYLALVVAIAGGLLSGDHGAGPRAAVRSMVCLVFFDSYDAIFLGAVRAADGLCFYLREQSGYRESLERVMNSAGEFMHSQDGVYDMITGVIKGGMLSVTNVFTHAGVLFCLLFIVRLTFVALNLLYVLGPLMIVGGAFGQGATLHHWGKSLFQVLLWPVFPCFVLLVNSYVSTNVPVAADNLSVSLSNNLILGALVILTPILTTMLVSNGGVAAIGALAWGIAIQTGAGMFKKAVFGGVGAGLGAAGLGAAGGSALVKSLAPAPKDLPRPDDAAPRTPTAPRRPSSTARRIRGI